MLLARKLQSDCIVSASAAGMDARAGGMEKERGHRVLERGRVVAFECSAVPKQR